MGSMNVGKVSFGNAQPTAGATQTAAQQPAVKKADKGDVVVIGGKEVKKSTLAKGGIIATAAAALGTLALAAKRGKGLNEALATINKAESNVDGEATKLFQNIKDGFGTFFGKGKEAYKTTLEKAKGLTTAGTGDKGANGVSEEIKDTVSGGKKPETEGVKKPEVETKEQPEVKQPEAQAEPVKQEEVKTKKGIAVQSGDSKEIEKQLKALDESVKTAQKELDTALEQQKTVQEKIKDFKNDPVFENKSDEEIVESLTKAKQNPKNNNEQIAQIDDILNAFEVSIPQKQAALQEATANKQHNYKNMENMLFKAKADELMAGDKGI